MFSWLLAFLLVITAGARLRGTEPRFVKGTPVVVVGEVTSPPKTRLGEQKLQVAVGPEHTDYTLHFFGAQVLGLNGRPLSEGRFGHGMWLRAEGSVMSDPRRIKVSRLQIIARDREGLAQTAYLPPGEEQGFIASVSGARQSLSGIPAPIERATPVVVVGRAGKGFGKSSRSGGLTVAAAGVEWAIALPDEAQLVDRLGSQIGIDDIQPEQWVQIQGWRTGDLQMRASRITLIGTNSAWRASRQYRADQPQGYAESVPETGLERKVLRGRIRHLDAEQGYLTLETAPGRERRVWLPSAEVGVRGRKSEPRYQVGDEVEVSVFTFR